MDIKNKHLSTKEQIVIYNRNNNKHDYASKGVLRYCLPKILFKGNSILVSFLQLIDMRIILMLNYVKQLETFKHISKY